MAESRRGEKKAKEKKELEVNESLKGAIFLPRNGGILFFIGMLW